MSGALSRHPVIRPLLKLARVPQRIWLTLRWRGGRALLRRAIGRGDRTAISWYADNWRPVAVVAAGQADAVAATTNPERVRVVAAVAGATPQEDVIVLGPGVVLERGWLEALQRAAYLDRDIAVIEPRILGGDGAVVSCGTFHERGTRRFAPRHAGRPADHAPANVTVPVTATAGLASYVKRAFLATLDDAPGDDPFDLCLRAWDGGWRVLHYPFVTLRSATGEIGAPGEGFWERWAGWLERAVARPDGGARVIYVTEDNGLGGGARVVCQHLVALRERGHEVELWSLHEGPDWFDLGDIPVRVFKDYPQLVEALEPLDAVKIATWWNTAMPVWRASARRGIPGYFVQDIETSYYPGHPEVHGPLLSGYREEFRFLTTSGWNRDRLAEHRVGARIVPPGLDDWRYDPPPVARRDDVVLALGRHNPLKNYGLTRAAWDALGAPRPELVLFGDAPELADAPGIRYVERPDDAAVARLLGEATVFVQTSAHEGFCLPVLEAMAAGAPVVCTDADGNMDFCADGENCLVPEATPEAVAAAIARLLADPALRERLAEAGRTTAREYAWSARADELDAWVREVASGA